MFTILAIVFGSLLSVVVLKILWWFEERNGEENYL